MCEAERPIGVFDSGVGGISVAAQVHALMPAEDLLYYGDNAYAPYGTRPPEEVLARVRFVANDLIGKGAKALLIACNTATSVAASTLRAELSVPVVGMEPALKLASQHRREGAILVMATPVTLALPKFAALMERYGEGAVPVPCAGLMEFVERGELHGAALNAHLALLLGDWGNWRDQTNRPVDAVVLGCTHYLYLHEEIACFFPPGTALLDGNLGTAQQLERVLDERGLLRGDGHEGQLILETSGDEGRIFPLMRQLFALGPGNSQF